jgi:anaerobic ribonucleoside-triphosphate reductase activating protein
MKIRLAITDIQRDSVVDGEGIRSVIWVQGCSHKCRECHNPETHSFDGGYLVDVELVKKSISTLEGQDGVTLSGGDPMYQPKECSEIASYCHKLKLNVWCYTGFTYEELIELSKNNSDILEFLSNIDVLIDGRFIVEQKSYDVKFRGSTNQRVIDVPKSLKVGKVCIKQGYENKNEEVLTNRKKYMFI